MSNDGHALHVETKYVTATDLCLGRVRKILHCIYIYWFAGIPSKMFLLFIFLQTIIYYKHIQA